MKDNDQKPLIVTCMRGKRNREKTAEKHLQVSISLIRGIPMEIRAHIFSTLKRSCKFKFCINRSLKKLKSIKHYLCPYIQISCTGTVNLKR